MYRLLAVLSGFLFLGLKIISQGSNEQLPAWQIGFFDIHHISTGRGNATYMIFPDGTTMLVDAGDISETHTRTMSERNSALKPNREKSAPAWVVDYIKSFAPKGREAVLDYALITHYHDDHFGEWDETRAISSKGNYALTGIMEVGDQIPIRTLLDRGFSFPIDLKGEAFRKECQEDEYHIVQTLEHYWKFIECQQKNNGLVHAELQPGVSSQIVLKHQPSDYPEFRVQNISVNGKIWTGFAEGEYQALFDEGEYPGENPLSTCIKISYGKFDYFTGGDISGVDGLGQTDFTSVESHIGPVTGPVDVATLNHHGNRDSQNAYYVRALRPRVWLGQSWSSDHPGHEVLRRITSTSIYPGPRDLFTTDMLEANVEVIGDSVARLYESLHGHIVVRVYPPGDRYEVFVLEDGTVERGVVKRVRTYSSR